MSKEPSIADGTIIGSTAKSEGSNRKQSIWPRAANDHLEPALYLVLFAAGAQITAPYILNLN